MPIVVVKSGRHPHEVMLLAVSAFSGFAGIVSFDKVSTRTIQTLPEPVARVYYYGLAASALLAFVGVLLAGLHGPLIERAGLWFLAGLWCAYGAAVLGVAFPQGLPASAVYMGLGAANVWRAVQIGVEQRRIHQAAVADRASEQLE